MKIGCRLVVVKVKVGQIGCADTCNTLVQGDVVAPSPGEHVTTLVGHADVKTRPRDCSTVTRHVAQWLHCWTAGLAARH